MSSVSDPLLPVQTSAMHDADIDVTDPAQSEAARERRFRCLRFGILAVAVAMGPLILLLLHMSSKEAGRDSCCSWLGAAGATFAFPAMPPALLAGGRRPLPIQGIAGSPGKGLPVEAMRRSGQVTATNISHELPWLQSRAEVLTRSWGIGSVLQFVQVAAQGDTMQSVVRNASAYSHAVVVAFVDGPPPVRRTAQEKFMAISGPDTAGLADSLPVPAINKAAGVLETTLKRRLFPISVGSAAFSKPAGSPPFAVYDVSSGQILLDRAVVRQMRSLAAMPEGLAAFADSMFAQIARFTGIREQHGLAAVAQVVLHAAVAAIGVAFAYQVPIWFCVACPAVLGLLAPLVINAGLGALADAACRHWQLPAEECNDLWYGAFAAGMLLSLAAAAPIVLICRLPECARRQ